VERRRRLGVTSSEEPRYNQARQPCPANFFVNHGISSSSSSSFPRSCSSREFTFRVFSFITKATQRFALIRGIFLMPATPLPEYRH
jgi:hypothetical protein